MEKRKNLSGGIILIVIGAGLLVNQFFPGLFNEVTWPYLIMGLGLIFLITAAITRTGSLAVPGFIIGGIGGILYYQTLTNNWESWAYIWTLIPGFVGLGIIASNIISPEETRRGYESGAILVAISAIAFLIFSNFMGLGLNSDIVFSGVIILIGLYLLARGIFSKKDKVEP